MRDQVLTMGHRGVVFGPCYLNNMWWICWDGYDEAVTMLEEEFQLIRESTCKES